MLKCNQNIFLKIQEGKEEMAYFIKFPLQREAPITKCRYQKQLLEDPINIES